MKARIIIYVLYHERLHSCTDWRAGSRAGSFTPCRAGRPAAFPSRWTSRPAAFPPCRANRPDAHNFVQIRRFPVFARNPSAQIRISALLQESLCVICIFLLANFQFKAFCKKSFLQAPPAPLPRLAGKPRLAFARRARAGRPAAFPSRRTNRPDAHNFVQIRRFPVFARNPSAQIRISALLQESLCVICIFLLANFQFGAFCKKSFLQAPPALPPRRARQAASGIRPPRAGWPRRHFPTMPSTPATPRRQASPRRKSDQGAPVPGSPLEAPPPPSTQSAAAPQK